VRVQRFGTRVAAGPRGRGVIAVPFDPDEVWGAKAEHRVGGTLNGRHVRGTIAPAGSGWAFTLTPMWMRDTGVAPGDEVIAELAPEGPQRGDLASDVSAALEASPAATAFFDTLAQFHRKAYLRWIDATGRRPNLRAARIAEVVDLLAAGIRQRPRSPQQPSTADSGRLPGGRAPIRSGIEKHHGVVGPSLSTEGRHDAEPPRVTKGNPRMPAKNAKAESGGFSAEERAAMKERAAELRAEGKKGAKKADGLQAVLDRIEQMAPEDRALAERVHVTVTATAPELLPKTWYGMPAYTNADGKIVVFFQDSGKFSYRYSTLGFQDAANLDNGDIWPVSYALKQWSPSAEKRVIELVKAAISDR
jgi:uncharacterized protein YdhG (YjbR/CyaY superfamily)